MRVLSCRRPASSSSARRCYASRGAGALRRETADELTNCLFRSREAGSQGLSLNFAAMRSVLEGDSGDGVGQRVQRWTLKRLSGVLQIETLWRFKAKYEPSWLPRYIVFDSSAKRAKAAGRT